MQEYTKSSGNVFLDLGFEPEVAAVMKIKADLRISLEKELERLKLNQTQAAEAIGIGRPALNQLLKGKLDKISIDKMVRMHSRLGKDVVVQVKKRRAKKIAPKAA